MVRFPDIFYAKILLFGEYSVIHGSMALSVPYGHFKGELRFLGEDRYTNIDLALESNRLMKEYHAALQTNAEEVAGLIDLAAFSADLGQGLYFESTIPQGYGLGSSGALTAALYARYSRRKSTHVRSLDNAGIRQLKREFAVLEAFFHGTSSGLDPLSSFLRYPILIESKEQISLVGLPRNRDYGKAGIFLAGTGLPRRTGELVDNFLRRCELDGDFLQRLRREYIPLNNSCITSIIRGDVQSFKKSLAGLSLFQLEEMKQMIPASLLDIWQKGLEDRHYYLKLCGAGGGGYFLGFAKKLDQVLEQFHAAGIETVTVYRAGL